MTILNSGTTKQYSSNWSRAFGAKAKAKTGKPAATKKQGSAKKVSKKSK